VKFLLDTNAVIALLQGDAALVSNLRRYEPDDFGIPSIIAHELFYGAYKSRRAASNLARLDALQFPIVEFDREDARAAGETRAALALAGTPIGGYDVLIAGQARARDLTVVTRDLSEFSRVGGLLLENW
jgi:tRNA(fMet)-specific endonuclease VapC